MTITVDELMDHAMVLTVNQKRLDIFMIRWDAYGLKRPKPFWGYHLTTGDHMGGLNLGKAIANCSFSHYALVKMAEAQNWPFIFILEDDALPCIHIKEKLPEALKDLPDDIQVLKLGNMAFDGFRSAPENEKLTSLGSCGSHAYIVFKSYYKDYERVFNNHNCIADCSVINYESHAHGPDCHIFSSTVNLFIQKDSSAAGYQSLHEKTQGRFYRLQTSMRGGEDFDYFGTSDKTNTIVPFDAIYVLTSRKTCDRLPYVKHQLSALNMPFNIQVHEKYMPESLLVREFYSRFMSAEKGQDLSYDAFWRIFGHYLTYQDALDHGYVRILVLEDDIQFIKDKIKLYAGLSVLPLGADIAHLEWHPDRDNPKYVDSANFNTYIEKNKQDWWIKYDEDPWFSIQGAGAYIISRKGMESLIDLQDSYARKAKDLPFRTADQMFDSGICAKYGLSCWFSMPVFAVHHWGTPDRRFRLPANDALYSWTKNYINNFSLTNYAWDFSKLKTEGGIK